MFDKKTIFHVIGVLALISLITPTRAQQVSTLDNGLDAAIREALQKPGGPLTEQDLLSLTNLSAGLRNISNVEGLEVAVNLSILDLDNNSITNFPIAGALTNLTILDLFNNQLSKFALSNALPKLAIIDLGFNSLTQCSLPTGLTNLGTLFLEGNALTNFNLPAGLTALTQLDLSDNELTSLTLPASLTNLTALFLGRNQLTALILPPDMTQLTMLQLDGNPNTRLVLSELLAATSLAPTVAFLRSQGFAVSTYPLTPQLITPRTIVGGAFTFAVEGPPGIYTALASANLSDWSVLATVTNEFGTARFSDETAPLSPQKFYRALQQIPPANMVFIPPNTFTMGSPTNDLDASIDERPQTTVTLTRGIWIGKYEVTQGEYLSVTGTNPSEFPGDLRNPVSSVSWFDATNYCWLLTQRERAAGRILPGSRYRLPTEAEWECAARAGTATRFSYGDDPNYASTTNYAWFLDLGKPDLTVHPVGQKLPNPWGLYDMHGNVWEWCQDDYGPLPGGIQIDPTGPASSLLRDKVARGGAYDYPNSSCRSATRLFRFPLWPDSDVGFRVVLAAEP